MCDCERDLVVVKVSAGMTVCVSYSKTAEVDQLK